ncbi:MAG: hypothetical protein WAM44_10340 [Chthoniobacterales bacterium]
MAAIAATARPELISPGGASETEAKGLLRGFGLKLGTARDETIADEKARSRFSGT